MKRFEYNFTMHCTTRNFASMADLLGYVPVAVVVSTKKATIKG